MKKLLSLSLKLFAVTALLAISCSPQVEEPLRDRSQKQVISEDSLLTLTQQRTFQYFWNGAEPHSGMARERFHVDGQYPHNDKNVVTTGGSGFGVMAILVGIERGFITRRQGVARLEKIVSFLESADRFHGAWPHWMHGDTGRVKPFGKKDDGGDLVETAFLVQGLLTARQYFRKGNKSEQQLAQRIDTLWRQVEWDWYQKEGENVLYWHWSPTYGWEMDFPLRGYNEVLITYILAASSPTHGIPAKVYHQGWARSGDITSEQTTYGHDLILEHNGAPKYGGPLFWAHYSYLGLDPRGLKDRYANYWQLNKNHTLINRRWVLVNPKNYEGYGKENWGLTASYTRTEDGGVGYAGHKPGMNSDRGVISPTAALSSFPYTPEYSMNALKNFYYTLGDSLLGKYGFYDAYSLEYDWFPDRYLAIDQGPIVAMIENYRSGMLWDLFMSAPEVQKGLRKLGFQSPHLPKDGSLMSEKKQWYKGNLHTHSYWSDGNDFPEMIMKWYKGHAYDFLALSDHNILAEGEKWLKVAKGSAAETNFKDYLDAYGREWVEYEENDSLYRVQLKTLSEYRSLFEEPGEFLVLKSEEISDRFKNKPIHVNATNIQHLIKPQGGSSVADVMQNNIDAVLEQREETGKPMFPHINHPNFGWSVTVADLKKLEGERFFEVYNGHPLVNNGGDSLRSGTEEMWDQVNTYYISHGKPLLYGIAVDDAHHYHRFDSTRANPGRGWVQVHSATLSADSLIAAMERGDFYASTGVRLTNITRRDATLSIDIKAEPGVDYTTKFIGVIENKKAQGASVLKKTTGTHASYSFKGNELFVRAKIISDKPKVNGFSRHEFEVAWTQPVTPQRNSHIKQRL